MPDSLPSAAADEVEEVENEGVTEVLIADCDKVETETKDDEDEDGTETNQRGGQPPLVDTATTSCTTATATEVVVIADPTTTATTTTAKSRGRRAVLSQKKIDPIIAPGFGTARDLQRLARELSIGTGSSLPVEAVQAMMESQGRGIRSGSSSRTTRGGGGSTTAAAAESATTAAATPISSAWADFMQEAGMPSETTTTAPDTTTTSTGKRSRNSNGSGSGDSGREKEKESAISAAASETASASASSSRVYNLTQTNNNNKKTKLDKDDVVGTSTTTTTTAANHSDGSGGGILLQTGTLDWSAVGRSKVKLDWTAPYMLSIPTRLPLPTAVRIASVYTAGHSCHSLAVSTTGVCYGWGRNEYSQLGSLGGSAITNSNIHLPTVMEFPAPVKSAATGKSHTLVLLTTGQVYAAGFNKVGQCGLRSSSTADQISTFRECVFPTQTAEGDDDDDDDDNTTTTIVQVACGEDFSVALCDSGYIYTTGSSEFGQLATGATGEHFITANKIAFANEFAFAKRTTFCHAPNEKLHSSSDQSAKAVPLAEDIRIQKIACGKHHALALEADANAVFPRVFTWGCGDYGVLGHGVQADEYYPRSVGALANLRLALVGASHLSIAAGQHCSLLQTANGHVYYWGKHRSVGEATMRPSLVDALANNQHVVTHMAAGGQTVVCCTANAQTVVWGQGPHGELGLSDLKSSAKPTFVPGLDSCRISSLACGYGHTLFVVRDDDDEDRAAVAKLPTLSPNAILDLADAASAAVPPPKKAAPKKTSGKKKK